MATNIRIIDRGEWGAKPPRATPTRVHWPAGGKLWVHHSGGASPTKSIESEMATVRAIQAFHQGSERGWIDIGYAYLIAPSGNVYEGRGARLLGAHCPGHNAEASVCILGNFEEDLPASPALASILWLARHLDRGSLAGHRDGYDTECPGDALMAWVREHRKVTAAQLVNLDRDAYLRIDINGEIHTGWSSNVGRLRWIVAHSLKTDRCAIAWRGPGLDSTGVWRGRADVRNVARSLITRYA